MKVDVFLSFPERSYILSDITSTFLKSPDASQHCMSVNSWIHRQQPRGRSEQSFARLQINIMHSFVNLVSHFTSRNASVLEELTTTSKFSCTTELWVDALTACDVTGGGFRFWAFIIYFLSAKHTHQTRSHTKACVKRNGFVVVCDGGWAH